MQSTYKGGVLFALNALRNWLEIHDEVLASKWIRKGGVLQKKANRNVREIIGAMIDDIDEFMLMGDNTSMRARRDNGRLEVFK